MLRKWILAAGLLVLTSAPAGAALVMTGAGPRVGFSVKPDQIVFGGHVVIGEIAPSTTFDPSLELGLGDNLTTVNFNLDLHYHFTINETDWKPYIGAGIGIAFVEADQSDFQDSSTTGVGGSLILGAGIPTKSGNRFFGEIKFGFGDEIADLKLMAGWNFKM